MKTKIVLLVTFLLLVALLGLIWQEKSAPGEQRFALAAPLIWQADWWTADSGGETSSGPTYSVSGTLGQPDAAPSGGMSSATYSLQGGFWPGVQGGYALYLPMVRR